LDCPCALILWLNNNNWFIQGDTRFLIYPQDTWGLGGATQQNNKISVDYKYIRFYQSALKRITSYFFAGIGYDLDYHVEINAQHEKHAEPAAIYRLSVRYK
jgi:hypothetical protein